jgi:hypothetical protein
MNGTIVLIAITAGAFVIFICAMLWANGNPKR